MSPAVPQEYLAGTSSGPNEAASAGELLVLAAVAEGEPPVEVELHPLAPRGRLPAPALVVPLAPGVALALEVAPVPPEALPPLLAPL